MEKLNFELKKEVINPLVLVRIDWVQHSSGIYKMLTDIEPNYKLTDTHKYVLKLFLLYFTGNIDFTKEKMSNGKYGNLENGIWLVGNTGSGKSTIFDVFRQYTCNIIKTNSFVRQYASEIIEEVKVYGTPVMDKFYHNFQEENKKPKPITLYIDDVWNRPDEVVNFGTKSHVMEQLMDIRYNVFQRYGVRTFISTNKGLAGLKQMDIDERILGRMSEQFNIIELESNDFRK